MKQLLRRRLSPKQWRAAERMKKRIERPLIAGIRSLAALFGYNIVRRKDYYSPLPVLSDLKKNADRWNRPSSLAGITYDLDLFQERLAVMMTAYYDEFGELPPYEQLAQRGFGPGYTEMDALTLYLMIRHQKPRRYLEVGSGLSTYYSFLAGERNKAEGFPLQITCIEPYPYDELRAIPGIAVREDEVQNVETALFQDLRAGDFLFIDSSHVLKLDGDVSFLFLEVLPCVQDGVFVHIHDVPFPYNIPFPAEYWVLGRSWPMFWNEAMVLQAFLCFNDRFDIVLSTPLLRHHNEAFLRRHVPLYKSVEEESNSFSSIWLQKKQRHT